MLPTISDGMTAEDMQQFHALPSGTVIEIQGQLELYLSYLQETKPETVNYHYIRPGTELYVQYGPNHVVLSKVQ